MKKIILCDSCGAINRIDIARLGSHGAVCGKCSKDLDTSAKVQSITFDKLEKIINHAQLPVVVDAYADWCGPCKMYGPLFNEVAQELWNKAEFYKIDTEKNPMISVKFGIRGIPTTLFFKNKQLINSQSGVMQKTDLGNTINYLSN
ncbi:thioredoxin [Flavobacterium alkalisoli]|uniref:thioredoxin n=1 Tax=Flavobacterium alkalisoli TaxID=2602769 RepID=UPI003A8EA115